MFQNIKIESSTDKTTSTNKPYKACEVLDESGASFKVNVWSDFPDFANIKAGSVVRAKLEQKGQYWNIVSETQAAPRGGRPNMDRIVEKKAALITEAQANKSKQIHEAQDRSAWMWAKTNASNLLADTPKSGMTLEQIADQVLDLATKIYNGEPYEPFS